MQVMSFYVLDCHALSRHSKDSVSRFKKIPAAAVIHMPLANRLPEISTTIDLTHAMAKSSAAGHRQITSSASPSSLGLGRKLQSGLSAFRRRFQDNNPTGDKAPAAAARQQPAVPARPAPRRGIKPPPPRPTKRSIRPPPPAPGKQPPRPQQPPPAYLVASVESKLASFGMGSTVIGFPPEGMTFAIVPFCLNPGDENDFRVHVYVNNYEEFHVTFDQIT